MFYNDTTNGDGIIQHFEDKTDLGTAYITGNTSNLKMANRLANTTLQDLWFVIWNNSGSWQYDDSNYTDLPRAITDLTSGTSIYALPTEALTVNRIEIKDANGNWVKLSVFDKEKSDFAVAQLETESGTPTHYYLINGTIKLIASPNYSSTGGLRVYFDRAAVSFNYDDTTQAPGFDSPFHYLVPLGMAISWLKTKQPNSPSLQEYKRDYELGKVSLADFVSEKFGDNLNPVLSTTTQNFE